MQVSSPLNQNLFLKVVDRANCSRSIGSGCIAALEAEKYLAELDDEENDLEKEKQAKKGETNGVQNVPEYRANPLL